MFRMTAVLGGLIGGAVGALIWAAVTYISGYEVGWIAWGVGALVGFCVALGNRDGALPTTTAGVLAVAIAALSVLAGKYAAVRLLMPDTDEIVSMFTANLDDEEVLISYVADDVANEFQSEGRPVTWPPGVDPANASREADYPADVWTEAETRWAGLAAEEKTAFRQRIEAQTRTNVEANLPEIRAMLAEGGFWASFNAMDILFFGLAMVTAFGVGGGTRRSEADVARDYQWAMKQVMIRVTLADGEIDDAEIRAIGDIYGQLTGTLLTDEEVRLEISQTHSLDEDLQGALRELAPHLNDHGKEMIVRAAVMVAAADGSVDEKEATTLAEIAGSIGMTQAHFDGTLARLTEAGPA